MLKLEQSDIEIQLSPRKKLKVTFVGNNAGCESGEVAKKLGILSPTIKRKLLDWKEKYLTQKHGFGVGTHYSIK